MGKFCSWYYLLMLIPVVFMGCKGKPEIIEQKCSICHKTSVVYQKKRPMVEWGRLIYGMKARGLKVTPDEEKSIMEALSRNYSK